MFAPSNANVIMGVGGVDLVGGKLVHVGCWTLPHNPRRAETTGIVAWWMVVPLDSLSIQLFTVRMEDLLTGIRVH